MNKTVNINLGGMFFHIDEDAYQKLTRYFEAIKRSLSNSSGQDEIIKDIEMRISELLNEKQVSDKYVVGLKDVDAVIAVMGQPEDYVIENDGNSTNNFTQSPYQRTKKLYRDKEKGMIGGVSAGLGHYFGIDPVWIRILLVLLVFAGFGTGILAYVILWIVTPEAITTSEKLEMTGEPVTISNIEKKVREEFENVSGKIKNVDYDKFGNQIKTGAGKLSNSFSDFLVTVFKVFAKVLGVFLIMTGVITLFFLLIGIFTLGSGAFIDFPWQGFIEAGNFTDYPVWSFGLLMFFAVGIPFFFLAILGFKLLAPQMKSIGSIAKYTLLALWIIAVSLAISIGIKQASAFAVDGRVLKKEILDYNPKDTLLLSFQHNAYFAKNIDERDDLMVTEDSTGTEIIYSNDVHIRIEKTNEKVAYLQIEKEASGVTLLEAKKRAEQIKYGYRIERNKIVFDNYFITELKNKYRDQQVEITLFVPEGALIKPDASIQNYDRSDDEFFNLHYSSDNYVYKVVENQVKCLNCPADENEYNDLEDEEVSINVSSDITEKDSTTTTTVEVNGNVINVTEKGKGLTTNKDGIIIKRN